MKEDIVKTAKERLQRAWEADRDNRREAAMDFQYLAGDQWPEEVRQQREKTNRPLLTINRLPHFVNQVINDIRQADLSIKVKPNDDRDEEVAEIYNGLIRQIQQKSSANHVIAQAASHQVSCGIGYFRIKTEYVDDVSFEQCIKLEAIDSPLNVYFDPNAREIDRSDAEWCIVTQEIPRKSFEAMWPNAQSVEMEAPSDYTTSALYWYHEDTVRVAEYWCKKDDSYDIIEMPNGDAVPVDELPDDYVKMLPDARRRTVKRKKVMSYLVSGGEILEGPFEFAGKYIPIVPVVGTEIPLEAYKYRHGLIRFARDAQQLYNFYRSASAEWVNLAPKAPFLVTEKMIGPYKRMWDEASVSPRPYLVYAPDEDNPAQPAPLREQPPALPAALLTEAEVAVDDLKGTTGIYDAALGQQGPQESGVAIGKRRLESDTANYHYADNLERALEYAGRVIIDLIPKIYDTERQVAILGEDGTEKKVPVNTPMWDEEDGTEALYNDLEQGNFDVAVSIGPSYTTKRQEAANSMIEFMQAYPSSAPVLGDLIAKNLDFPGADEMAARLKKMLPPGVLEDEETMGPTPEQQHQMEMMKGQQELEQIRMKLMELQVASESQKQENALREQVMKEEHQAAQHAREMAKIAADTQLAELRAYAEGSKISAQSAIEAQKSHNQELKQVGDEQKSLRELERLYEQRRTDAGDGSRGDNQ